MVRDGIPRVNFYFLLHGQEFRVVISSAEWFGTDGTEFRVVFFSAEGFGTEFMGVCFVLFSQISKIIPDPDVMIGLLEACHIHKLELFL